MQGTINKTINRKKITYNVNSCLEYILYNYFMERSINANGVNYYPLILYNGGLY